MQIRNNSECVHGGYGNEYLFSCPPLARSLDQRQRLSSHPFTPSPSNESTPMETKLATCVATCPGALAVRKSIKGEWVDPRRVLVNILAKLMFPSRCVDPRVQLYGRVKSIASISDKMSNNGLGVHQILDIIGIRAITQHTRDCYRLISRIHMEFQAMEHEYDDYVAAPKPNGYQSIHTTVITPFGFPVEIQIRTQWMHALSERGAASHRRYKKGRVLWMPVHSAPNYSFTSGDIA